eukprot:CAMPEP_0181121866 /NCGR_PEP_ID=MMETSP1071-20121207/24984_1 /TAXON_ID=35127 /ORGANISM="Thalassiosira sp., Strain NH16" /LENGTH=362 /DNA_ID=CAMNT_0023206749 /DNA_START=96 /DNA_END=1184 /DNA_ORIENTATION=-
MPRRILGQSRQRARPQRGTRGTLLLALGGILLFVVILLNLSAMSSLNDYNDLLALNHELPPPRNPAFEEQNTHPVLQKALIKTKGPGWDITPSWFFNTKTPQDCQWQTFRATSSETAQMCCHKDNDFLSQKIAKEGRTRHCDILVQLWKDSTTKTKNSIYLDIGANIGSCVMEMLLSTDANILAFEPHPVNGWLLQQTLSKLDPSLQRRVVLLPIGLGKEFATNKIYASQRNMGNSVVGTIVKDFEWEKDSDFVPLDIVIEPLSNILSPQVNIPLMKLDIQGFECEVLQGLTPELAANIAKIKFEVAPKWLLSHNCKDLYQHFTNLGFRVQNEKTGQILEGGIAGKRDMEAIATNTKLLRIA